MDAAGEGEVEVVWKDRATSREDLAVAGSEPAVVFRG